GADRPRALGPSAGPRRLPHFGHPAQSQRVGALDVERPLLRLTRRRQPAWGTVRAAVPRHGDNLPRGSAARLPCMRPVQDIASCVTCPPWTVTTAYGDPSWCQTVYSPAGTVGNTAA